MRKEENSFDTVRATSITAIIVRDACRIGERILNLTGFCFCADGYSLNPLCAFFVSLSLSFQLFCTEARFIVHLLCIILYLG